MLINDPIYINRVQYIIGSVVNSRSLEKVRIGECKAAFIFSSKHATKNAAHDDAVTVMRALALKKNAPNLPLHVQVLLPENKAHFDNLADSMVCTEELKLGLLAQSCRCPGFATLMYMLTTSITDGNYKSIVSSISKDNGAREWVKEYLDGAKQEVYPTILPKHMRGMKFSEASALLYSQFGIVMFALGIPNSSHSKKSEIRFRLDELLNSNPELIESVNRDFVRLVASDFDLYVNPHDYILSGGELAFLIGDDDRVAKEIPNFCPADIVNMDYVDCGIEAITFRLEIKQPNKRSKGLKEIPEIVNEKQSNIIRRVSTSSRESSGIEELINMEDEMPASGGIVTPSSAPALGGKDKLPSDLFANDQEKPVPKNIIIHSSSAESSTSKDARNLVSRILSHAMGITNSANHMRSVSAASYAGNHRFENHIIVCDASSKFPQNLEYFIAPLRSFHISKSKTSKYPTIVILSPALPSDQQRELLNKFEQVVIVHGTPLSRKDLQFVCVDKCLKVVILSDSCQAKTSIERTADATSLLSVLNVEALTSQRDSKDLFIITECIHEENMAFLGENEVRFKDSITAKKRTDLALMKPALISGSSYCQSLLDTIICQNYFNPYLLNILRHILFSGTFETMDLPRGTAHSHIWLLDVPDHLEGVKYGDMFQYLVRKHGAVSMGLYRNTRSMQSTPAAGAMSVFQSLLSTLVRKPRPAVSNAKGSNNGLYQNYVCVNPGPESLIRQGDCIYVLARFKPQL